MTRFVMATFTFSDRILVEELEPVFTAIGDDWIRLNGLTWLLWTPKPLPHVLTLLRGHMGPKDTVFLADLGESMWGNVPPWIFDWMQTKRPDWKRFKGEEARLAALRLAAPAQPAQPAPPAAPKGLPG